MQKIVAKEAEIDKFFVNNLVKVLVEKIKARKAKRDAKRAAKLQAQA